VHSVIITGFGEVKPDSVTLDTPQIALITVIVARIGRVIGRGRIIC
jgi:hypothetical protein